MAGPIPVSSLVAVLVICIGIGLFCGTGYVGCDLLQEALSTGRYTDIPTSAPQEFPDKVENVVKPIQISILCLSGFMVIGIIYFLFQAFMATATISSTDYTKHSLLCGNKCWTAVSVVCSYLLTFLWVLIAVAAFYCFLITFMLYSNPDPATINLKTYGLKGGVIEFNTGEGDDFIRSMEQAYVLFAIFAGSALIVLIGMINLTMCHSANLAHLKTATHWQEYYQRRSEDQMELSTYTNHGAVQSTNEVNLNIH